MSTEFGFYPRTGWRGRAQLSSMHREPEKSMWQWLLETARWVTDGMKG